jgi:hypothetical protein
MGGLGGADEQTLSYAPSLRHTDTLTVMIDLSGNLCLR